MNKTEDLAFQTVVEEEEKSVDLLKVINKYLYHWPLFLLGIILFLSIAFIYLRYAQPVYSVNSTLLIKDDKKGAMQGSGDLLNELDLFGSSKVVDNEIEILKSKTLMRKVVDRLNLSVAFEIEGRIKNSSLYTSKMFKFDVVQMDSTWYGKELHLSFLKENNYLLEDRNSGQQVRGQLNQIQRTIFGVYNIQSLNKSILSVNTPIRLTILDPQQITNECLSNLSIILTNKQSSVLNLSYQATVPERGQDILNTLIQVYNEAALADKNKTTQSTLQFIDERLKLITGELTEVEKDVEGFKSSRGLMDISSDASALLENVKANDIKLNEVSIQISVIKDIQRYLNSNSPLEKLPSTLGINDPVLLGQITQLSELQLQRDQLSATTAENNPLLTPLTKQIETTRAGIKSSLKNILSVLEVSKSDLEKNNLQFQGYIKRLPGQERQLISIKRQQTIKESLYLYLLQKKEEAALSYASAVADSRIVDPAYYSNVPINPKRKVVYLGSLFLGILLPFGFIYLRNLLNTTLQGKDQLEELTSTPILGQISQNESLQSLVVLENSRTAIAEQFRSLRTNLQFLKGNHNGELGAVTLFTSSMSGEGKSFVASNLATALAMSGRKTVLIELDLRKPKVSKYLELENLVGMSNYLIGKATIEDIIRPTKINKNLFVIGSGPIPPNPTELLLQSELSRLVEYLKQNYDEIIIDTPPIGLVTDAQLISSSADLTVYLVRQGVTFKDQIKNLEELYRNQKFPNLSVLLNGISSNTGYGYSYGYGYGYYSEENSKKGGFNGLLKNILNRF